MDCSFVSLVFQSISTVALVGMFLCMFIQTFFSWDPEE